MSKMVHVAADIESVGVDLKNPLIWSLTLNYGKKMQCYENCFGLSAKQLPKQVVQMLEDPNVCKVFHNALFDCTYIAMTWGIIVRNIECTMLNEICINGWTPPSKKRRQDGTVNYTPEELAIQKRYGTALKFTLPRYGFKSPNKELTQNFVNRPKGLNWTQEEREYMFDDVRDLLKLRDLQELVLRRDSQLEVAALESKACEKIVEMRYKGIKVDQKIWMSLAVAAEKEYAKRMAVLPKQVANWGSEKQVKDYFRSIGILIPTYKDIPDIIAQTGNKTLIALKHAMELKKSVTSYGRNWFEEGHFHKDSRVRCDVFQIKRTGRMSMFKPNLQQLPRKGYHRTAFIPENGCLFGIGDFSGQEIGIMAAMADEKIWIDALLRGDDVHSLTASLLYEHEWENGYAKKCTFPQKCECPIHSDLRQNAKVLNFMLAYGGGPQKFATLTGLDMRSSKFVIKKYKRIVPSITKCLWDNGKSALQTGESYSADPYQRRRLLLADEEWKIVNQGKNNPIQAAGANMLKLAMVSLPEKLPIVLVVHDEIITELPKSSAAKDIKILKTVMEKSADYITGIKGLIPAEPRLAKNMAKSKAQEELPFDLNELYED